MRADAGGRGAMSQPPIFVDLRGQLVDAETYVRPLLDEHPRLDYTLKDLRPAHMPWAQHYAFPNNYKLGNIYLNRAYCTLKERENARLQAQPPYPHYEAHTIPHILLSKNGVLDEAATYVRPLLEDRPGLDYTLDDLAPARAPRGQEQAFSQNYDRSYRYLQDLRWRHAKREFESPAARDDRLFREHYGLH